MKKALIPSIVNVMDPRPVTRWKITGTAPSLKITLTAGAEVIPTIPRVRINEARYLPRKGTTRMVKDKKTRRKISKFSNRCKL
jgi:hypothetical protein